jgi:hypothetical protein
MEYMICIDNKQIPSRLTLGKEYEVLNTSTSNHNTSRYVWVISDDGVRRAYLARRFALRSDLRDAALSNII